MKGNKIEVCQPITDDEVEAFFQANHMLDKEFTGNERNEDLDRHPKLKEFLDHSSKQRRYFYSVNCLPLHQPLQTLQKLYHLPDTMPDECNKGHYKHFSNFFGKVTTEEHRLQKS